MMGDKSALRTFLAERDAPSPRGGHNLRALAGGSCPDCGLELTVGRVQEKHHEWRERRMPHDPITTAGLVGSILGLGWPLSVLILGIMFRDQHAVDAGRLLGRF